jgi:hypothetical protein
MAGRALFINEGWLHIDKQEIILHLLFEGAYNSSARL